MNEAKSSPPRTLWELWGQWSEVAARVWTNAMNNGKVAEIDLSGVNRAWMELATAMQKQMAENVQALFDPRELWKLWFDMTIDIWRITIKMGGDPLRMIAGWVKVIENVRARTSSGEPVSFDPFTLFNEWYTTTGKPLASTVEDFITSEQFVTFTSPLLESYSHFISTFREASEAYFKTLRLPTLSDIARLAELIISLEEKVDDVAEAVERVGGQVAQDATSAAGITSIEQRLSQIETRLDKVLTLLAKGEAEPTEATSAISYINDEKQKRGRVQDSGERSIKGHSLVEAVPFTNNDA